MLRVCSVFNLPAVKLNGVTKVILLSLETQACHRGR